MIGFGDFHIQEATGQKESLIKFYKEKLKEVDLDKIDENLILEIGAEFGKSLPKHKFKEKEYDKIWIKYPILGTRFEDKIAIIHGKYQAYNNNHPFSPDGFAMMELPFNFSMLIRGNPEQDHSKDSCLYEEKIEVFS